MRMFSLISIVVVLGIALWWSMAQFSHDATLITPHMNQDSGVYTETPIDQAKKAKELMESNSARSKEYQELP